MTEICRCSHCGSSFLRSNDGFSQRFVTSDGAVSFAKVAIMALSNVKIKISLALRYSLVVGLRMQIFGVYVCSSESILSLLTLDPE